jgi:hypothetical protein
MISQGPNRESEKINIGLKGYGYLELDIGGFTQQAEELYGP